MPPIPTDDAMIALAAKTIALLAAAHVHQGSVLPDPDVSVADRVVSSARTFEIYLTDGPDPRSEAAEPVERPKR
jgi:hypothetical protein